MKRSKRLTALILSALLATQMFAGLTVSAKDSQVFEKFENGNFEENTDLYDDWFIANPDTVSIIEEPGNTTNHVMYVDASGGHMYNKMLFSVRKNSEYRLDFKVKTITDTGSTVAEVFNRSTMKADSGYYRSDSDATTKNQWKDMSVTFHTTGSDEVYLQLVSMHSGKYYYDDFKLVSLNGQNLGFEEEGSTDSNIVGNFNSRFNIETEVVHSGNQSIAMPESGYCTSQIRFAVKPYTQYDLTFWAYVGNEKEANDELVYTVTKPLTENGRYYYSDELDMVNATTEVAKSYSLVSKAEPRTWVTPSGEWKKQTVTFVTGEETDAWLVLRRTLNKLNKICIDDIHLKALRSVGNGDFEVGQSTVDGWTVSDATVVSEGTDSVLKLDSADNTKIAEAAQVVTTAVIPKVELRYNYKNAVGGHNVEILNADTNERIMEVVQNHTETADWVTKTIVVPTDKVNSVYNMKVRFYNCDESSEVYIDDVELVNEAPRIIEAHLYGATVEGNTLVVNIERIDETGDALDFARVDWQYQGDDGKWVTIKGGNDLYELSVDASIAGKNVRAKVIPYGKKGYVTDAYFTNVVNADTLADSVAYVQKKMSLYGNWLLGWYKAPTDSGIANRHFGLANVTHVLNVSYTSDKNASGAYRYATWFFAGLDSATASRDGSNIVIDCKFNAPMAIHQTNGLKVNNTKVTDMAGASVALIDSKQYLGHPNDNKHYTDVTISRGATITIPESLLEGQESLTIKVDPVLGYTPASVTVAVPEKPKAKYEYVEVNGLSATYATGDENITVSAIGTVANVGSDTAIDTPIYVAVYDGNGKLAGVTVYEAGALVKGGQEGLLFADITLPLNTNMTNAKLSVFVWDDASTKGMDPFASKTTVDVVAE